METVQDDDPSVIDAFRDVVNRPDIQADLTKDKRHWQQLCCSMDTLGDTAMAVAAYEAAQPSNELGFRYLLVYGLLQVLFVQQDALQHAADAIGFPLELSEELRCIRDIRNRAVGHPTKVSRGKVKRSYGIVQVSLHREGFALSSFDWDESEALEFISIQNMILEQRAFLLEKLGEMTAMLEQRNA